MPPERPLIAIPWRAIVAATALALLAWAALAWLTAVAVHVFPHA